MYVDLRTIIETIAGLLLSGGVSLTVYAINAKVNQRYLELKHEVSQEYVTNKSIDKLIERFENMIGKFDAQFSERMSKLDAQLTERMNAGFSAVRNCLPPYNNNTH